MDHLVKKALMQIGVRDLKAIVAVAEASSFRKAAMRMNLGQSAISRRIGKLEDALGVSLFERRTTGARLTTAGQAFFARAHTVLDDLTSAIETAQSAGIGENGHLRIGLIASISRGAVRNLVAAYRKRHPIVDLCFVETHLNQLFSELSHRRLDVVIAAGGPPREIGDSLTLTREPIFLAVPSDSVLRDLGRLKWRDVRDARFIVSAREPGPEIHDFIIRKVSDLGRPAQVQRHRLGREGIMTLVGMGFGVSIVADHWRGVRYPNVSFIPIGDDDERVPFSLTWHPENDNPALRRFISLARIEAKRNGALS